MDSRQATTIWKRFAAGIRGWRKPLLLLSVIRPRNAAKGFSQRLIPEDHLEIKLEGV